MKGGSNMGVQLRGNNGRDATWKKVMALTATCAARARTRRSTALRAPGEKWSWTDGNVGEGAAGIALAAALATPGAVAMGCGPTAAHTIPAANLRITRTPTVTITTVARMAPTKALAACGRKVIAGSVSPPLITMTHAITSGQ